MIAYAGGIFWIGWITGLIIYVIESKNKFVRFNAMQSILLGIAVIVVWFGSFIIQFVLPDIVGCLLGPVFGLLGIGYFILTIVLMVKSYGGEKIVLPLIGQMAERQA